MNKKIKKKIYNLSQKNKIVEKLYRYAHNLKVKSMLTMDDENYARAYYKDKIGKTLDIKNPKTFDEKLWYLKLHNRNPLLTVCSDKYKVREYVKKCGLEHILNDLYGVYDRAEDIDFSKFKEPTFLKCNHTSGCNIIYDPKKNFDKNCFIKNFNRALKSDYSIQSREWNYKHIERKIIAEKVLHNKNGTELVDYRLMCFNGQPKLIMMDVDTCDENGTHYYGAKRNVYDIEQNLLDIKFTREQHKLEFPLSSDKCTEMCRYASTLSKPLYNVPIDVDTL